MDQELYEKTEKLVNSIGIPSQPKIIVDIDNEMQKEDPDFGAISDLVSRDVAMSAKILKVCNSPYFGLKHKADTVNKALSVLGMKNFKNVIFASALRDTMNTTNIREKDFEYFCNHSLFVAKVAQTVAMRLPSEIRVEVDPNLAYMAGLFHDTAIPLLSNKFKDYLKEVSEGLKSKDNMVSVEENLYQSNHCIAGYFVAKSWHMPENLCIAIQNHHTDDINKVESLSARRMLAVLILSESLIYYKDNNMTDIFDVLNYNIGEEKYESIMFELDFTRDDISDVEDSMDQIVETIGAG